MVQFLSINFFSWISSIFVGFFKSSRFLCHPVPMVFYKFCNNFVVRVFVFSTLYLLRKGWVSSCLLDCEIGTVTNTFTQHIMFERQVVVGNNYVARM